MQPTFPKQSMSSFTVVSERHEFYISDLDNHILIENSVDGVVIRATRDNFPAHRKAFFVRHLAVEGYIPDHYEWFSDTADDGFLGVRWIVRTISDDKTVSDRIRKWCTRRNARYGCLFILWLALFVWAARHTTHGL